MDEEEARAQAYRDQTQRRMLAIDARAAALRGNDALRAALDDNWSAFTKAGAELDPERDYEGDYPEQRA